MRSCFKKCLAQTQPTQGPGGGPDTDKCEEVKEGLEDTYHALEMSSERESEGARPWQMLRPW